MTVPRRMTLLLCGLFVVLLGSTSFAFQPRREGSRFDSFVIDDPSSTIGVATRSIEALDPLDPIRAGWESFKAVHGGGWSIYLDARSGAPLLVEGAGIPWIAGSRPVADGAVTLDSLEASLRSFLSTNRSLMLADDSEIVLNREASGPLTPETWQLIFDRKVAGVPVFGDRYVFTIGHGNLISFGASRWVAIQTSSVPSIGSSDALGELGSYLGLTEWENIRVLDPGTLILIPLRADETNGGRFAGPIGSGYSSALAWRLVIKAEGEPGTWVGLVDAHTGAILHFSDTDKYAQVKGGVYPVSDDQLCPDGCEQPGYPMPFPDLSINGSPSTGNTMGLFDCMPGGSAATTTLAGPYVRVSDNCGAVSESVTCDNDLDLQTSVGSDCIVPPGSSPGNTHSSRTGFYHLNRIAEHGRAWLPANTWLTQQLTDNVNIDSTCNAFWDGFSVNFYKSGGGCNNTGEIAGVFLHEWGHGLDNNDGGGYDNPSEAYADITAFMNTHVSCIGRGFFQSGNCSGYGNACLNCTGIRDQDWDKRQNHTPSTPSGFVQNNCGGGDAPCGREPHCEGYIGGETLWDLAARDLPAMGLSQNTAWQLTDKLWYKSRQGSGGNAYNCSLPNSDGCGATSWFTKVRNIDDEDGNLSNGTPHAAAIFAAFNRHAIACGTANDNSNKNSSTCPSIGSTTLSSTAGSGAASLSWTAVPNAASYNVLRNDAGCSAGSTIVATVPAPGTTFTDTGLADGFTEYYAVQAVGSNSACEGALSNCQSVTPQPFAGSVSFDRASYGCSVLVNIIVRDGNIGAPTTSVTIWSTTEPGPQTITLTQASPGSAKYAGSIMTTPNPPAADGMLSLTNSDTVSAQYIDADDGNGNHGVVRNTAASADCVAPFISGIGTSGVNDTQASVGWSTDQVSDSVLTWGSVKPPTTVTSSTATVTSHSISLMGLQQCTVYYYEVSSTDPSGNVATNDNAGQFYHFETLGNFPGTGLQPCHQGRAFLTRPDYSCTEGIGIKIIDIDLNRNSSLVETVLVDATSSTETNPETVVLTETGPDTSTFTGTIFADPGAVAHDGKVQAKNGDLLTVTYHDSDDGTGASSVAYATAVADCQGGLVTNLKIVDEPPFRAYVSWNSSEATTSRVDYGSTTALGKSVSDSALTTAHQVTITDLNECSLQYFKVSGTDARGNTRTDDRGGLLYTFESGRVPGKIFIDGFETLAGWTLEGEYQIDAPQGKGTNNPDPTKAYNGTKVLGMDLTGLGASPGNYENSINVAATSPVINAGSLSSVKLIYRRWLNHDIGQQDQARLEGLKSNTWNLIWHSAQTTPTTESSWSLQSYDISSIAAGNSNFQLRFRTITNFFANRSGWNIDDVIVKDGSKPDSEACGACGNKPSFAGLSSATDLNACADTGVALSWQAAAAWGTGVSGTYSVYRDTTPNFTPSASNRIAAGLSATSYSDASAPNSVPLYYLVRAENNETCSNGPANAGVTDDNTVYAAVRDDVSQPTPPSVGSSVRASGINDAHLRLVWNSVSGASSYRIYRSDNPQFTGAVQVGPVSGLLFEDVGELTSSINRFYIVRAANGCGVEGP